MSKAALLNRLKGCVSYGKFKLSSGRESDYYVDMKKALFDPISIALIGSVIYEEWKRVSFRSVGGYGLGSVPVITSVQLKFGTVIGGFCVRSSEKQYGIDREFDGVILGDCLIVDDVATSGATLIKACNVVEKAGGRVIGVVPLVCRREGALSLLKDYNYKPLFNISELVV